ncbi:hypothetical protein BLA29_011095 [Euroglyphus maynei]|uniref:Uncharacterized protein n=1 Tax=Euroglyphus maynei TaxID=6958 RepID=A0A1Y3AMJ4_EURMA|nr:hypothetical protein BLA29_011095 [Euroglyphus maynei]
MATSALYLLMALGKKANREEMIAKSVQQQQQAGSSSSNGNNRSTISTAPTSILVQNEEIPVPTGTSSFNNKVLY